jgi:leucyl aminopeptidase
MRMKIVKKKSYLPEKHVCVVVPFFRGTPPAELWRAFPELEFPARREKFKGEIGEALVCHSLEQQRLYLLVGAGRAGDAADARKLACKTMSLLREHRVARALIRLITPASLPAEYLRNLGDYLHLNNYRFDRYQKKKRQAVERIQLVCTPRTRWRADEWHAREIVLDEASRVRDLVNEIPAKVNPDSLVEAVSAEAPRLGLKLEVWRQKELEANGMNGLLAVGASACCPPALLFLSHAPEKFSRTVALVGKGITFDSGGLNLKPGSGMEEMKSDMAGAAAVLAVVRVAAALKLPVKVVALAALAENMPGRRAYKPGDIITFANRKTVEVVNTDAEGRLVLADALIMAARQKPEMIIELSTLTGAMVVALGDGMAGLMCRNKKLAQSLLQAAETTGELLWELPLPGEYRESIVSKVADLKNANYNGASAIKAGIFLSEFAGKVPFAHLDIAGTAFLSKPNFCMSAEGATGFGVRLLVQFLQNLG